MTTQRDDNPPGRVSTPRPDSLQAHERLEKNHKTGEERNPRNDRGRGDERSQAQGRGNDPDRG